MPFKGFPRSFIIPLIINHGPLNASIVFVNYGGFTMPSLGRKFCFENRLVGEFPYHAAIYTHTADIYELETLLKELPDVAIHVLAHSHFGFNLVQLERYPNLFLYPSFDPLTSRKVLEKLDFYLDINPYDEVDQMTQRIHQLGLPIFSFEGTNHVENGENQVFADDQVQEMVAAIRDYLKRNEKKHGNK